jgi:hypothetical protein
MHACGEKLSGQRASLYSVALNMTLFMSIKNPLTDFLERDFFALN